MRDHAKSHDPRKPDGTQDSGAVKKASGARESATAKAGIMGRSKRSLCCPFGGGGPEALADATLDAVTSTIKHAPKAIPTLVGLVFAAVGSAAALLAAGGGLSISLAWIGYELWKKKKPPS
jgi:hypothetical protein